MVLQDHPSESPLKFTLQMPQDTLDPEGYMYFECFWGVFWGCFMATILVWIGLYLKTPVNLKNYTILWSVSKIIYKESWTPHTPTTYM
jgi:hypothetical protein